MDLFAVKDTKSTDLHSFYYLKSKNRSQYPQSTDLRLKSKKREQALIWQASLLIEIKNGLIVPADVIFADAKLI